MSRSGSRFANVAGAKERLAKGSDDIASTRPPFADHVGETYHFLTRCLQHRIVVHRLGEQLLQLGVVVLKRLQSLASETSRSPYLAFHL
jgi:hypothetical protein